MNGAIDVLKKDHERLRQILVNLERLLKEKDVPEIMLKLFLNHLERELEGHLKKEEDYLMPTLFSVAGKLKRYHNERDYEDIRTYIQFLRIVLRERYPTSATDIQAAGSHLIDTLREHMEEEEKVLFPIAERVLGQGMLETIASQMKT